MSTISNLGNRWQQLYTGNQSNDSKALQKTQGSGATPATQSGSPLDLTSRVTSLGNATVDFAQSFVSSFTQALFGDDAKGATIDFDSASLDVSSGYAMGVQQTRDANGVTNAAAFSMTDSSHFIGKGTITTADGRKFDFEVEVQYNAEMDAAASQTQANNSDAANAQTDQTPTKDLPVVQVPNIDFPGTLADLFQLIGRDLQTALSTNDKDSNAASDGIDRSALRNLSLRLLNLVDSKDANTYSAPTAADKAKATAASDADAASDATAPAAPAPAAVPAPPSPAAADAAAAPAKDTANTAQPVQPPSA